MNLIGYFVFGFQIAMKNYLAFRTTGTINGTLVTSGNITATSTNTTIINGGASQTILSGTLGAIDNGAKTFDSFTTIKNALSSATKFKAVPFVGMALGMLDFLLGGGGEQSSGVTITFPTQYAIQTNTKVTLNTNSFSSGNIISSRNGIGTRLYLPGTQNQPVNGLTRSTRTLWE